MAATALWRWVLLRGSRQPLVVAGWLILLAWIPLVESLQPIPHSVEAPRMVLNWCYPVGTFGVLLALVSLGGLEAFLRRLDPQTRWAAEVGALGLAGPAMQLPMLLGACIFGVSKLDLAAGLPDILCLDLRLAGIALVTLVPRIPTALRASSFLGIVWLAPAFVRADGLGAVAAPLLDPALVLSRPSLEAWISSLSVALASLLMVRLLRTTGRERR